MYEHILAYHHRSARAAITKAELETGERRWNLFRLAELHNEAFTSALRGMVRAEFQEARRAA